MEVQVEGNSREEEVDVLCAGAVKGGSSSVLNTACQLCVKFLVKMTSTDAHEKITRVCMRAT